MPHAEVFVVDGDGVLGGTITLADLSEDTLDDSSDGLLNANDVARNHPSVAEANGGFDQALRLMRDSGEELRRRGRDARRENVARCDCAAELGTDLSNRA